MRIGFDARWYNDSGVGTYVVGLLQALAAFAPELEIVAYESAGNRIPHLDSLRLRRIELRSSKYSLASQVELAYRCRHDKLDVFHSPFYPIPLMSGCPVVVNIHDIIPFLFRIYPQPKQALVKMGYRMASRGTRILTGSHNAAHDIETVLGVSAERIAVVHYAVAREHFHPDGDSGELDLLATKYGIRPPYVATASPRNWRTKNCATAEDVLLLTDKRAAARFQTVVYGPGTRRSVANLNVIQCGFIPVQDLATVFRHAHAFLLTSLYEGFGLPLLEAMSCGCPVVSSNGGALAEVAANGAQVFDPFDTEGMSAALAKLLDDDVHRELWRKRALARAAQFSWRQAAHQTADVYRQACGIQPNHGFSLSPTHDAQSTNC